MIKSQRFITAHDVARKAGVSQSAVSRSFTIGKSIAPQTKMKVLLAAKQLGYRPNAIAASLITRRSRIIAVVASYLQNHYYPEVLEAMSAALSKRGYQILLFTGNLEKNDASMLDDILRYQVDGIILFSAELNSLLAKECKNAAVPVLLFNRTTPDENISSVTGENEKGGKAIAAHFNELDFKLIAFMAGIENSSTSKEREKGFVSTLNAPLFARVTGEYNYEKAQAAMLSLLEKPIIPDAIFCANDHMAFAAMNIIRDVCGLKIPQDIAIAGFDNVSSANWSNYALTSYSQPIQAMVNSAVEQIITQIETENSPIQKISVEGALIIRASTGDKNARI